VVVVDGHDLFRSGLVALLQSAPAIEVVGQASRGRLGIRLSHELRAQVVLIDMGLSDINGGAAVREILDQAGEARVIALSATSSKHDLEHEVEAAATAGASGFVLKNTPVRDVAAAIRAVATGGAWLSPPVAAIALDRLRSDARDRSTVPKPSGDSLSARELEVIRLVARGLDNPEIATELWISVRTVRNHITSALAKLDLRNRVELATYAIRHGLD
jgi:DNA-binding NarL/FixJ family response regulator